MNESEFDFCGWATKNDIECGDGAIIRRDAFEHCDGTRVPLVWNHQYDSPFNTLGYAILENRPQGVYAYGKFNGTEEGKVAKELVMHGDITQMSIRANRLKRNGPEVLHGNILELSLVHAGANPGAKIESTIVHGVDLEEAIIYTEEEMEILHSDTTNEPKNKEPEKKEKEMANEDKTLQDIIDTMTEEQKNVMYALVAQAIEDNEGGDNDSMKHNVFDIDDKMDDTLMHSEIMADAISDAKRYGSLKESFLEHAASYGIDNIDYLFPDAQTINNTPEFISREMGWVQKVMNDVHHTPFSRIKSVFANITEDEARAKGYIKGKLKKEEVFSLLKRSTTPTTIYKKQKLDRDDVVDITDFDVVAWLKGEMRLMLNEEIARAILVGDGRLGSSDDKINESNIRPIWKDADLYTIKSVVEFAKTDTSEMKAKNFIKAAIKARKNYKGSGQPSLYTTEDMITDMLLLEDEIGRPLYADEAQLAKKLRVKEIVPVPVMENLTRTDDESKTLTLGGIIVNLSDYNVGADKGGAVNLFDDFDIDYNAMKYLIETRCSGALTKPYSAIALEFKEAETL